MDIASYIKVSGGGDSWLFRGGSCGKLQVWNIYFLTSYYICVSVCLYISALFVCFIHLFVLKLFIQRFIISFAVLGGSDVKLGL